MIVYKTNKSFLRDIVHLTRSYTMIRIFRGVLGIGVFSLIVCLPIIQMEVEHFFVIDRGIFSFLGIVLSILLVFRTNTAYDRWWEGRKQWGALVNHCRNLAIQLNVTLPVDDIDTRRYFAIRISNFCIALTEHLREGVKLDEFLELTPKDRALYENRDHIPNQISMEIQSKVQQIFRAGAIETADHINIRIHTQALLDILGACERIKKTPIPFSYAVYLKIFIVSYSILLPFSLVADLGYWAILVTMFVIFAFLGVELMAEEIEDPFGLDCNDLPTGTIAKTISTNVCEIFSLIEYTEQREAELYEKIF